MFEEPDVLIETDRLLLRDVTEQDTQLVYQLYSLPESSRYEYWNPVDAAKTKRIVSKWRREQYQKPRPAFHIMVLLKTTKAMVGICGLEIGFNPDEAGKIGYVGYRYFPDEWNKG